MPPKQSSLRSFSELGDAPGRPRAKDVLIDRRLDEVAATKRRSDREHQDRPFTQTPTGRAFLARCDVIPRLAAYMASPGAPKPPRAISRLVLLVDFETLALVAVDGLLNALVAAWASNDHSSPI